MRTFDLSMDGCFRMKGDDTVRRPILGITMGDPAGCGPEITVKALKAPGLYERCRPLVIADAAVIEDGLRICGEKQMRVNRVSAVKDAVFQPGVIDVYHLELVDMQRFAYGKVSAMCGEAAFRCVEKAIQLALEGQVDGTVTNALNKEALNLAGHAYSGHTEIYADLTGTDRYTMMLAHGDLRVVHVSTHVSLREACDRVKKQRVLEVIRIAWEGCRRLGISNPRVGVAGLNPHAGETGLFGREEIDEILPAIELARAEGIDAEGPLPPDSIFSKARGGWYHVVVAMYHDQGHIPLKVVGFVYNRARGKWDEVSGVNITLGLPIIRCSVDHGTAFGHAGQGVQSEASLVNAVDYACRLAEIGDCSRRGVEK